jgi:probable F420-dependent oxidoreductase
MCHYHGRAMKFGAGLPLTATSDTAVLKDFVQAVDEAEFDLLTLAGHILTAENGRFPDRPAPTYTGPFHDPFVLFGYLAALTRHVHFRPNILILPLYPTAIVAKQAAELQQLSGGRFELGVGISWNPVEYAALGQGFSSRARRLEEQVTLLRRLWSEPLVPFSGQYHQFDGVGLNRLLSTPIPIWFGSGVDNEQVLRRIARLGDGWAPMGDPTALLPRLHEFLSEVGRDPAQFGLTLRLVAGSEGPEAWVTDARKLEALGATYVTLGAPPDLPPAQALRRIIEAKRTLAAEMSRVTA